MSLNRPSAMEHFDRSGVISEAGGQVVFPMNQKRVGYHFQNQSKNNMFLEVLPATVTDDNKNSTRWLVTPGETLYHEQFAPLNEVHVIGIPGDIYAASEFGI